jgi:hypothetical protein
MSNKYLVRIVGDSVEVVADSHMEAEKIGRRILMNDLIVAVRSLGSETDCPVNKNNN